MPKRDELKNRVEEIFSEVQSPLPQESNEVFQNAFENASAGMCLTGIDGSFLMVNPAFAATLGYAPEEMLGKNFQVLTYPDDIKIGGEALRAMLAGESHTTRIQKRYVHKDGHPVWAELNITLLRDENGKPEHFVSFIQDISEQKNTAELLEKRVRELNCLNDIGYRIDEQPPLAEFLDWAAKRIPDAMLYPEECIVAIEYQDHIYGNPAARDLSSKVVGGIRVAGELMGWLHIAYSQPRSFIDAESALVGGIVSRLSGYIQTVHQQEEAERRTKELTILNEMSSSLTSVLDIDTLVKTIYKYTAKLTDVTNFFVALYNPESQMVSFPIAYSDSVLTQIDTRPIGNSLTDYIIRHGEPLLLTDRVVERAEKIGIQLVLYGKPIPAESWLGVPVMYAGTVQGVIAVQSVTTPGKYKEYDREIMTNIARSTANALVLARQYQQIQDAAAESFVFRQGLENSTDAVFITDMQGTITYVNPAFMKTYGYSREEAVGKTPRILKSGYIAQEGYQQFWDNLLNQQIVAGEIINKCKDGRLIPVEGANIPVMNEQGSPIGFLAIHRDISERKQAESELRESQEMLAKRASELTAVAQVSTAVATILNPSDLLQKVVDLTQEYFKLYHAHIYLMEENFASLILAAGAGEAGRTMIKQRWEIPLDRENSIVARAARNRKGMVVNDVRSDPDFLPNELLPSTASEMAVPLITGENLLGVLDVQSDQMDFFTEDDVAVYTSLAYQIAIALNNARLYSRTQIALAEAQTLYDATAMVNRAGSLEDLLQVLVNNTALKTLDQVIFELFDQVWTDRHPETMVNGAVWERSGEIKEPVGTIYRMEDYPFLLEYLRPDEPLLLVDVQKDRRVDKNTLDMAGRLDFHGTAYWPLTVAGRWFGVLAGRSGSLLRLAREDIRLIETLVEQVANSIDRIRLGQDMEDRLREMSSLQRLMSREAWAAYQSRMSSEGRGYLFNQVELQPVTVDMLPALAPDNFSATVSGGMSESFLGREKSSFTTTLSVRGEPIGVLGVKKPEVLTEEDEAFLGAISEQVAQAMERARLMEQTQKSAVELQAVAEVSTATSTILDPTQLLQSVVDLAKRNFGLYHAHVYLLDETGTSFMLAEGSGEIGRSMAAEGWGIEVNDPISMVARVGRSRKGEFISDVRQQPNYLPNPLLPNTLSELAVPMVVGDQLLGVFDVQSDTANRFGQDDVRTFSTLASQTSVALQNAKLYEEQLATVERLRELDNMKSAFLANMSHELRTPLNSILGFTQVILEGLDGDLTDLMISDLELVEKNGKHLLNLINDVLDMAKIEAGRLNLNPEPINLYDLLEDVLLSNSTLARDKNLTMNMNADPAGEWVTIADHVRLRQVFINLISNSVKFTEMGGITIEMERILPAHEKEQERIQVRVKDTGIGVPPNKLEEIFEAFSQVDSSTTRKVSGTGLGLPISRRLIEMHGGRLWAFSKGIPGEGSVFYLELPVAKAE
jgi:PAS domain S-box-containing protein